MFESIEQRNGTSHCESRVVDESGSRCLCGTKSKLGIDPTLASQSMLFSRKIFRLGGTRNVALPLCSGLMVKVTSTREKSWAAAW